MVASLWEEGLAVRVGLGGRQLALVREFLVAIKDGTPLLSPLTFFFLPALWRFILSLLFCILYFVFVFGSFCPAHILCSCSFEVI